MRKHNYVVGLRDEEACVFSKNGYAFSLLTLTEAKELIQQLNPPVNGGARRIFRLVEVRQKRRVGKNPASAGEGL